MNQITLFIFLFLFSASSHAQNIVLIQNENDSIQKKDAILILPGFADSKKGRKAQLEEFSKLGIDVFIPEYIHKHSYAKTLENVTNYIKENRLLEYENLHCFTYIMGTWVLNTYIQEHGFGNIKTIVSDRSPLQERAPRLVKDKLSLVGRITKGKLVNEFSTIDYPQISNPDSVKIGLIIENKATKLIRIYKKTVLSYGPISMNADSLGQENDDFVYTYLNHDEMYVRFDVVGEMIREFIKYGNFPNESKKEPFDFDLFTKYKED